MNTFLKLGLRAVIFAFALVVCLFLLMLAAAEGGLSLLNGAGEFLEGFG